MATIQPDEFARTFGAVLDEVTSAFQAVGAAHMLIGGLAVGIRSRERATKDLDFSIVGTADTAARLVDAMERVGYVSTVQGDLGPGAVIRFRRVLQDGIERWIDVLVAGTPYEEEAIARAQPVRFLTRDVPVATVEDLIVLKLIAGRLQDLADVGALIEDNQEDLDEAYLASKTDEWGVREALDRVRAQVAAR